MAQTGYSKIQIYSSSTATDTPSAGNLTNDTNGSELAINITDGKLFYKDASGNVQVLASKAGNVNVASFSAGTTGFTPSSATTGAVTLAGTLATTNGGTGLTTFTAANNAIYSTSSSVLVAGTLPVLAGGTGVTTSTGTGNNVLATTPTITTPNISGNLTFTSSNAGIVFNNSSATVNSTLNDYETGTWTPNLGGITTVNFSVNSGNYVKVGRVVTLWWDFTVSSYSGGSWNGQVGGLPFVVSGSQAGYSASRTRDSGLFNSSLATGYQLVLFAQQNLAYLYCQVDNSGTAGFGTAESPAPLGSSGRCTGTITYYATF